MEQGQNQNVVNELGTHVSSLLKAKTHLRELQHQCRETRDLISFEEEKIEVLMQKLAIKQCQAGSTKIVITESKRTPVANLKTILPVIQRVFNASTQQMQVLLEEVSNFKKANAFVTTKLSCRQSKLASASSTPKPKPLPARKLAPFAGGGAGSTSGSAGSNINASGNSNRVITPAEIHESSPLSSVMDFISSAY